MTGFLICKLVKSEILPYKSKDPSVPVGKSALLQAENLKDLFAITDNIKEAVPDKDLVWIIKINYLLTFNYKVNLNIFIQKSYN